MKWVCPRRQTQGVVGLYVVHSHTPLWVCSEVSGLQEHRFWAVSLASSSPVSKDRSSVIFLSQVEHGRPEGLFQNSGVRSKSASPSILATCPNIERCGDLTVEESAACSVMQRTSAFLTVMWPAANTTGPMRQFAADHWLTGILTRTASVLV